MGGRHPRGCERQSKNAGGAFRGGDDVQEEGAGGGGRGGEGGPLLVFVKTSQGGGEGGAVRVWHRAYPLRRPQSPRPGARPGDVADEEAVGEESADGGPPLSSRPPPARRGWRRARDGPTPAHVTAALTTRHPPPSTRHQPPARRVLHGHRRWGCGRQVLSATPRLTRQHQHRPHRKKHTTKARIEASPAWEHAILPAPHPPPPSFAPFFPHPRRC